MKTNLKPLLTTLVLLVGLARVGAQGITAFTYQGQLKDNGTNANGAYTMIFKLYDALTAGNQVGSTINSSATLANGLFTVNLDFGNVFNGAARWLDITVSNGVTQTLSPRVQVLPAPYAQFAAVAATVTNGAIMNAQLAGNAVNTTNIQNNAITTTQIASGAVTNRNLTANAVNATNIAGGQVVKSLNGLTDAVSIMPGANVGIFTNNNTIQISSFIPNIKLFYNVTNVTFIVPTNVSRIMVEMWGGGGGGGIGGYDVTNAIAIPGGGGGAGAYAWNVFTVTPGASFIVNPGKGGAGGSVFANTSTDGTGSSFGSLITASGGSRGHDGPGIFGGGAGGSGGLTTTGSLANVQGGDGRSGADGGDGGGVWRGGSGGQHPNGVGEGGPGGKTDSGQDGEFGVVIVYY